MSDPPTHEITQWLTDWSNGDRSALEKLTPLVYRELRAIAHRHVASRKNGTLATTEVVHDV